MITFPNSETYTTVSTSEDSENLISKKTLDGFEPTTIRYREGVSPLKALTLLFICGFSASFLGLFIGRHFPTNLDSICTAHTSKYSIVTEDIDVTYSTVQFNGSFEKENIYRQDASPEVDAAWDALGVTLRPVIVPEDLAIESGLTKDHARRAKKYGGGVPVFVEGFHQIHCLNLLRKSLYYNYDHYHSKKEVEFHDSDHVVRWHVSHCLDFLRQRLMCDLDIGTFGQVWVKHPTPRPWVDFNTRHTCRNFDAIRAWNEEKQIPAELPDDWWEWPSDDVKIWKEAP